MRRGIVAVLLLVAFVLQGTISVLAGTTGSLSGTVLDASTQQPIAGAHVTVTSPSQQTSTTTSATGTFNFVSLAPDTYSVAVTAAGHQNVTRDGVTVQADQNVQVSLAAQPVLKQIGQVRARSNTELVRPGTTADVYSVSAAQQAAVAGVGGGGGLNNAYSAIATVPGAIVPANQIGWYQTVHIRGGDFDQTGYELDGVPVNRSFDNYPSGAASSLGQQELQVYTGATPASAEGSGLAGYINQVIRTGTFPGNGMGALGLGSPSFYNKISGEYGAATPNRNFSYYIGSGGYNEKFRYINQQDGANLTANDGTIFGLATPPTYVASGGSPCADISYSGCYALADPNNVGAGGYGPGGYIAGPYTFGQVEFLKVRNTVANFHLGLPKRNGTKDDVQLLYINDQINTEFSTSPNDLAGMLATLRANGINPVTGGGVGFPVYQNGYSYNGPLAQPLPSNYQALTSAYHFPSVGFGGVFPNGDPIRPSTRDTNDNAQAIVKLQYQHNINSNSYLRLYGYTYYSNWFSEGPVSAWLFNNAYAGFNSRDYELFSHTRGVSLTYANQFNEKNLFTFQAATTGSTTVRDNNRQMNTDAGFRSRFAVLVSSTNPFGGLCYNQSAPTVARTCDPSVAGGVRASWLTLPGAYNGTLGPALAAASGSICGSGAAAGPCEYVVAENGRQATYNTVRPRFSNFSLQDEWRPSSKLTFNAGIRFDSFTFQGSDTTGTPARTMFVNSFNLTHCLQGNNIGTIAPGAACPAGSSPLTFNNIPSQSFTYTEWQPRLGFTYSLDPTTVLRGSYGVYVQPPNSAFEQYNALQQNLPSIGGFAQFIRYGFNTPGHAVRPALSYNTDFSLEKAFAPDWSLKLSPFLRQTRDQIQNFWLDQPTAFISGLNVGQLKARGVELALRKGDFNRDGLSGQLAFTYTYTTVKYSKLPNGATVLDGINNDIAQYNAYTSYCASHTTDARCAGGLDTGVSGARLPTAPCYATGGAPMALAGGACPAGSIVNPYWTAPVQDLINTQQDFVPYSILPGAVGFSALSYNVPYALTAVLNYKHQRFTITPSLQFFAGTRYGSPETWPGIDPAAGCGALATGTAGDPRYAPGSPAGAAYDARTCNGLVGANGGTGSIPNPYSGRFDNLGAWTQPSALLGNIQMTYQASPRVKLVGTFANVLNACFGGSRTAWTDGNYCSYTIVQGANVNPVGNVYNPGATFQHMVKFPYEGAYGQANVNGSSTKNPFQFFIEAQLKL